MAGAGTVYLVHLDHHGGVFYSSHLALVLLKLVSDRLCNVYLTVFLVFCFVYIILSVY